MNKTGVIVINLNTLSYTKNCIEDLLKQNVPFDLTLVDQASHEKGIGEVFKWAQSQWNNRGRLNIIYNKINKSLNQVWNDFAQQAPNQYLCYLNNDVRIPSNFIKDSESVFITEPNVSITIHSTNHPTWLSKATHKLHYNIPQNQKIKQGWDFTIRKSDWELIPEIFKIFYGDDFIFYKTLLKNKKIAYILSSPILHFQGMSQRPHEAGFKVSYPKRNDNFRDDTHAWASTGWPHDHHSLTDFTRIKPTVNLVRRYANKIL
jgi:GT2 family glycosyltransferase